MTVDPEDGLSELPHALMVQNSVLVIRQMREVHTTIAELIEKLENGDQADDSGFGGMGGGGQQGGFGGSFFSIPERRPDGK